MITILNNRRRVFGFGVLLSASIVVCILLNPPILQSAEKLVLATLYP